MKSSGDYWNYRVIKIHDEMYNEDIYEIREVFYVDNSNIVAWTARPINLHFYDCYDYKNFIKAIKRATKRTVLKLIKIKEKANAAIASTADAALK